MQGSKEDANDRRQVPKVSSSFSDVPRQPTFAEIKAYPTFTPDYEVTRHDATYTKRRAKGENICIIDFSTPNAVIESL